MNLNVTFAESEQTLTPDFGEFVVVGAGGSNADLSDYYTKDEIAEQLDDYATEEYVGQKIAEAQLGGSEGGVDLSIYYTKSETDKAIQTAVDAVELLPGPKGDPGQPGERGEPGPAGADGQPGEDGYSPVRGVDYWTEADKQEIIAEIPGADLTGYATEEYVGKKIAEAQLGGDGGGVDLSAYYTKTETDAAIKTAVDAVELLPGKDGKDGKDGSNGVSATHSWNGTVLTITSASGSSSVDLKGETGAAGANGKDGYTPVKNVDYFDGKDGKDGVDGQPGADGRTPVKGTDYWTDADKAEMVNAVLAALPVYNGEVG